VRGAIALLLLIFVNVFAAIDEAVVIYLTEDTPLGGGKNGMIEKRSNLPVHVPLIVSFKIDPPELENYRI
jgi:hypothetical protein